MTTRERIERILRERDMQIYQLIEPGQIFALNKDDEGILFIGNKEGKPFIEKLYWKEQ